MALILRLVGLLQVKSEAFVEKCVAFRLGEEGREEGVGFREMRSISFRREEGREE